MSKLNRIRRKKNENYFTSSNEILKNKKISTKSKGLHTIVMALPDDWDFTINGIVSILAEGKDAVYSMIRELCESGYCVRTEIRNKGKFAGYEYEFAECLSESEPQRDLSDTVKPDTDLSYTMNPTQSNTYNINHLSNQIPKEEEEEVVCVPTLNVEAKNPEFEKKRKTHTKRNKILSTPVEIAEEVFNIVLSIPCQDVIHLTDISDLNLWRETLNNKKAQMTDSQFATRSFVQQHIGYCVDNYKKTKIKQNEVTKNAKQQFIPASEIRANRKRREIQYFNDVDRQIAERDEELARERENPPILQLTDAENC